MSNLKNLNPYERHKLIINEYVLNRAGATRSLKRDESHDKRDIDIIRENHKFIWDDDEEGSGDLTWEEQLAKKYYDKLFKEYCICDLVRYKENKVALRWRTEKEVILGKGQFICGHKPCGENNNLRSWEVNFAYMELGEKKNALVKLRLCIECSEKLNYRSKKREIKRMKKNSKKKHRRRSRSKSKKDDSSNLEQEDKDLQSHSKMETENLMEDNSESSCEEELQQSSAEPENIWSSQIEKSEEPSREEEFEKYLEDLLF